ncbi:MAG: hypothetical protein ACOC85_05655 [Thermoplasmatota archaeon]
MPGFEIERLVDTNLISSLIYDITKLGLKKADYIGKMDYHKILYLLRKKLDDNNGVKDSLQFYWYRHGPYSTLIEGSIKDLKRENVLASSEKSKGEGFILDDEYDHGYDEVDYETALDKITDILDDYDLFADRDKILKHQIYIYAPFKFQKFYKFDFLPKVKNLKDGSLLSIRGYGDEELIKLLSLAEAKLPLDERFDDFNKVFSRFVTDSNLFFKNIDNEFYEDGLEIFCDISEEMWKVFCKRLRTVEYDPYYERKVDNWVGMYKKSLSALIEKIKEFELFVDENIGLSGDMKVARDSAWGVVAKDIIEN